MSDDAPPSTRMLPELDDRNRAFWTGGADGALNIPFCAFQRGPAFIESGHLCMKERDLVLDVFYGVL